MTSTRSIALGRVGLVAFGILIALVAIEIWARINHRAPWYERLVAEQKAHLEFPYKANSLGLRDREYSSEKPAGTHRTLVVGDSFTFGSGVPDQRNVFTEILERQLNEYRPIPAIERYEVINGGLPGSLTYQWAELFYEIRDRIDPDVLLIVFFLRDGTRTHSIPDFFGQIRDRITARNRGSLAYRHFATYRFIRDLRDRKTVARLYREKFEQSYFGDEEQTKEWRAAQQNLTTLRAMADERDCRTGLVVFPMLVDLQASEYPFQRICDLLVLYARDTSMPVHNLLPDFRGHFAPDLWVSAYDQHPNERAHAIAAESMYPFFVNLIR